MSVPKKFSPTNFSCPQKILATLAYAELFSYPLSLEEIHRWLISSRQTSFPTVQKCLTRLHRQKQVFEKNGFYSLRYLQSPDLSRRQKLLLSCQKTPYLLQGLACLRRLPFIQGIFITGSLAVNNSLPEDDIDFLVVTSRGRLWSARVLSVCLFSLLGIRRLPQESKAVNKICLNLFLDEQSLTVPLSKQNLFTAHEVLQARPVWQKKNLYRRFLLANHWVRKYLANSFQAQTQASLFIASSAASRKKSFKTPFSFYFLEKLAFVLQKKWMSSRRTQESISPRQAFFHPLNKSSLVLRAFSQRLSEIKGFA